MTGKNFNVFMLLLMIYLTARKIKFGFEIRITTLLVPNAFYFIKVTLCTYLLPFKSYITQSVKF